MAGGFEVLFARMALTLGLGERDALQDALVIHERGGARLPFGRLLVERGVLTQSESAEVAAELDRYLARRAARAQAAAEAPAEPPREKKAASETGEKSATSARLKPAAEPAPTEKKRGSDVARIESARVKATGSEKSGRLKPPTDRLSEKKSDLGRIDSARVKTGEDPPEKKGASDLGRIDSARVKTSADPPEKKSGSGRLKPADVAEKRSGASARLKASPEPSSERKQSARLKSPAEPPVPDKKSTSGSARLKSPAEASSERKSTSGSARLKPPADAAHDKQWALFERATKDPLERLVGRQVGAATVDRLLETGEVATIFAGRHGDDERPVWVKILRPERIRDKAALERFTREATVLKKIDHPNIGRVLDAGVLDKLKVNVQGTQVPLRYVTIEASSGDPLSKLMAREGVLSPERAVKIARAVALGLGAAHRAGIVHRDVRPANVLVSEEGSVRLVGFGLAKDTSVPGRLTATGQITGHPTYVAPEVAEHDEVDGRADVYSLGCVLYTALAGHPPFESQSVVKLLGLHLNAKAPPLRQAFPHIASRLSNLVERALSKLAADRPDADELARLLGAKDLLDGGTEPPKWKGDSEAELKKMLAINESSGIADVHGPSCAACELPLEGPAGDGVVYGSPLCKRCLERIESLDLCAACFARLDDAGRDSATMFAARAHCKGCTARVTLPCTSCSATVALADLPRGAARADGERLAHVTCPRRGG